MGRDGPITSVFAFKDLAPRPQERCAVSSSPFRENDVDLPFGYPIGTPADWDNNFLRTHQEPHTPGRRATTRTPSTTEST